MNLQGADIKVKTAIPAFQLPKITIFVQFLTCFELQHFFRYNESSYPNVNGILCVWWQKF